MRIRSIRVKNFRSIRDAELQVGDLTALVGRNGAGKSAFLGALRLFYDQKAPLSEADFYAENTDESIEIEITYDELGAHARSQFSNYVQGDTLGVMGVFALTGGKKSNSFHGSRLQNPDFARIRNRSGRSGLLDDYRKLRNDGRYGELGAQSSVAGAQKAMAQWEVDHPDECERLPDDGQFFGYTNVGHSYLLQHTQFILVPAVRDASDDANEGRGSAITEIINRVIRSALSSNPEFDALMQRTQHDFAQIMANNAEPELQSLQEALTVTLKSYVPDAAVNLQWSELPQLTMPEPQTDVRLEEDGYLSTVTHTGHGLQRAFIVTLLQQLSTARETNDVQDETADATSAAEQATPSATASPCLMLAIEEPELYQHPSRQRHLAAVLRDLTKQTDSGSPADTQIIYTTHSPLFVRLDRFDDVRIVRKLNSAPEAPKATGVYSTTVDSIASKLDKSSGGSFNETNFEARLQAVMTPMVNEGFFADVAVLVEGDGDRAALLETAEAMGCSLDAQGIAVIPCGGKGNLVRPLVIFSELSIPTYVVWDGDKDVAKPAENRQLLRILQLTEEDWPRYVGPTSACFEHTLEDTLKMEIGEHIYEQSMTNAIQHYTLRGNNSRKNALVIQRVVADAFKNGNGSRTLISIVERITQMRSRNQP